MPWWAWLLIGAVAGAVGLFVAFWVVVIGDYLRHGARGPGS